jgi:hypothetical protein
VEQTTKQGARKSKGRIWLIVVGSILSILGIIIGSIRVGACGRGLFPDYSAAHDLDIVAGGNGAMALCNRNMPVYAGLTWSLLLPGIALIVIALILRSKSKKRTASAVLATPSPAPSSSPSVVARMEDLSRLKDQGLISVDEFDAKRQELLSGL